jgi:hypothetical protein
VIVIGFKLNIEIRKILGHSSSYSSDFAKTNQTGRSTFLRSRKGSSKHAPPSAAASMGNFTFFVLQTIGKFLFN